MLNRWFAVGGMVGSALFLVVAFIIGETRSGYSHVSQGISALSETGAPTPWAQSVNFIVLGLLTIGLAVGLHRGINHGAGSVLGPALIAAFGLLAAIGNGVFPADPANAPETAIGQVHSLTAGLGFMAVIVSAFVLPRRLRLDSRWRDLEAPSRWLGSGAAVLMVVFLLANEEVMLTRWVGLLQRVFGATVLLWLFLLALRLFRVSLGPAERLITHR